jgi:hypothetical protein
MVQLTKKVNLALGGTEEQKSLAREIWALMSGQGFTMAKNTPIRQTLENLANYLAKKQNPGLDEDSLPTKSGELKETLDKALSASPAVFLREETDDGEVSFKTTKQGSAPPATPVPLDHHSFKTRLYDAARLVEELSEEERAKLTSIAGEARPEVLQPHLPFAASPVAEPARASTPPPPAMPTSKVVEAALAGSIPASTPPKPATPPKEAKPVETAPTITTPAKTVPPVTETPAPVEAETPPPPVIETPVAQPLSTAVPAILSLADGVDIDLNTGTNELYAQYGDYFKAALKPALEEDIRLANFLDNWYLEEAIERFSKGDFRRIRDFILESQLPVSDITLATELYGKRPEARDFEAFRFALDLRLSKEKRDFEFVGANDDRLWATPGLPQIGNSVRKAADVAVDYKYLEDADLNEASNVMVEDGRKVWYHVLTYYEYENGVLPYNASAKEMFPNPLSEEQKTVILWLEATQTYETYPAELRYPSASRGGWIAGLEGFFSNNLIPGAILIIRQGVRSNHFEIEYKQGLEQESRLLFYDERRQKFVFRTIGYTCEVDEGMMLSPEHCSRLDGQKRMDEAERKRTDHIVGRAFEVGGERTSDGYYASIDALLPIVNIERPFSREYLHSLLTGGNTAFRADPNMPGAFTYKPIGQRR